jgi:hypothetical protein
MMSKTQVHLMIGCARLRQLGASLSLRRPGFDPRSVRVGFVVEKVALAQTPPPPPQSILVFRCQFHSTPAPSFVKMRKH